MGKGQGCSFLPQSIATTLQIKFTDYRLIKPACYLVHNRPNIYLLEKRAGCFPQPVRLADDTHIVEKSGEREKIDHYQDLKVEVQKDLEGQR